MISDEIIANFEEQGKMSFLEATTVEKITKFEDIAYVHVSRH